MPETEENVNPELAPEPEAVAEIVPESEPKPKLDKSKIQMFPPDIYPGTNKPVKR